jgi:spermidine/putrescine transport system substrate-binding protein
MMRRYCVLAALLLASAPLAARDKLHVYNWSEYLPDAVIEAFEVRCGCDLVYDVYTSNEELLAKLAAGATGYDVLVPTDYAVTALIARGQLLELDHSLIPNLRNLKPAFRDPSFDPGNRYSVAYAFGPTVLGYNVAKLESLGVPADSWAAIFEPEHLRKLKGRVTVLDDQRELIGVALIYLGYSPNDRDRAHWDRARDLILRAKPYWAAFNASNYATLLASGNVWVSHGYSVDIFQAAEEAAQAQAGIEIGYAIPAEGAYMSTDNMVIHKDAPNPRLAHEFIDFILDGEQSAVLSNEIGIGNPNAAAEPYIDEQVLGDPVLSPDGDVLRRLHSISELDARDRRDMNRLWTEIKVR